MKLPTIRPRSEQKHVEGGKKITICEKTGRRRRRRRSFRKTEKARDIWFQGPQKVETL